MGLISEIISGVLSPFFSFLNKKEDVNLEKFKVDGKVDIAAVQAHVEALKARRDALKEAMMYRGFRFAQYTFVYPLGFWFTAIIFYCVFSPYYDWIKPVKALPEGVMPWATGIVAFLFMMSKIDDWRRKT